MSFLFQEREPHDDDQSQIRSNPHPPRRQEQANDDEQDADGVVVVYGSTYTYDEELPPEMTTKFGGKVAIEVSKLQKKIKQDAERALAFTVEEARKAMRMFSGSLEEFRNTSSNSSAVSVSPYVLAVLEAGGTVSMLVALEKWYKKSEECSLLAMGGLATLVVSDPSSGLTIASIGAITTIEQVVQQYPKSQMVSSDAIEVLLSLAGQVVTRPLVAGEDCRGLVQTAMAQFPMDEDIQLEGCEYFLEIGKLDGIKEDLLQEKKLGKLLGHALDQFREDISKRAVQWYSS
ncbi:unnamed protein product [Cylindrotheca closterium]|uniref:Uncharacterized protein n=1 Tax=Cylindrotheca closterium TaxID=2856 RepID=A0AAD2JI21_9STRA|nr:unnamed protein product [Cylindrotheca closterium]